MAISNVILYYVESIVVRRYIIVFRRIDPFSRECKRSNWLAKLFLALRTDQARLAAAEMIAAGIDENDAAALDAAFAWGIAGVSSDMQLVQVL